MSSRNQVHLLGDHENLNLINVCRDLKKSAKGPAKLKGKHVVKSKKKKIYVGSDDDSTSASSNISFQESDCSTNWCDLNDEEVQGENEKENNSSIVNSLKENQEDSNKSLNVEEGSNVLVKYDGNVYPGKILRKLPESALVSAMQKAGHNIWKWPSKPDIIWCNNSEIIQAINEPVLISKRGLYRITELVELE
ncbi:unnamed protein product [Arctia plantaginis]|uniref:Uncharacterized protein n=1 Tax=Arctia plantaginis TaxID=874455 RepID=A0A8S0Z3W3_ARCPL|nr:unnamed protein product [Arctia plantaginis]